MVSIAGDSIIGIIGSIVALGILIANIVFMVKASSELQNPNANVNLSKTFADVMIVINIVLAVLFGIYLIYNAYRIATSEQQRTAHKEKAKQFFLGSKAGALAKKPVPLPD